MEFESKIILEEMKRIREKVVLFHLDTNRILLLSLRTLLLLLWLFIMILSIMNEFNSQSISILLLTLYIQILLLKKMQFFLANRRMEKLYTKKNITEVKIKYIFREDEIETKSFIGEKTFESIITFNAIKKSVIHSNSCLIIYTTGRLVSNLFGSRPRYIHFNSLDEEDRMKLINLFKNKVNY